MITVHKPWGSEKWITHNDKYTGKFIYVNAGEELSKQYHEKKHETIYLLGGKMIIEIGEPTSSLYKVIHIDSNNADEERTFILSPKTIHKIMAITNCILIEWSTSEVDDIVRISDKYGRSSDGSRLRKTPITTNRKTTKSPNKSIK